MQEQVAVCLDFTKREVFGDPERNVDCRATRDSAQRIIEVLNILAAGLQQIDDVLWVGWPARVPDAFGPSPRRSRKVVEDGIVTDRKRFPPRRYIGPKANPRRIPSPGAGSIRERNYVQPPEDFIVKKPILNQLPAFRSWRSPWSLRLNLSSISIVATLPPRWILPQVYSHVADAASQVIPLIAPSRPHQSPPLPTPSPYPASTPHLPPPPHNPSSC